jgi:hypothetical protein
VVAETGATWVTAHWQLLTPRCRRSSTATAVAVSLVEQTIARNIDR